MTRTVFYAWQSDLPQSTNRNFLEDCLERAIAVANRTRNENDRLALDKDTQGVAGTPVVADIIFEKIDACAVFVPDLSFVARTQAGKGVPNPNVSIELGHALGLDNGKRVVVLFNEAFGSPEELPFDMKHRRWPLKYALNESATAGSRRAIRDDLVPVLAKALAMAADRTEEVPESSGVDLMDSLPPHAVAPVESSFYGQTQAMSIARTEAYDKEGRPSEHVYWHHGPCAWLRVVPETPRGFSRAQLRKVVEGSAPMLSAFGTRESSRVLPNEYGVVAIAENESKLTDIAMQITQVFTSGELWGLNRLLIEPVRAEPRRFTIPWPETERVFEEALAGYLQFAYMAAGEKPPLHIVAGVALARQAVLVRQHPKWFADAPKPARCVQETICWVGMIEDWVAPPARLLRPFYEAIWDACHLDYAEWNIAT